MVKDFFEFQIINDDHGNHSHNGPFYFIKGVKNNKVRMKADALLIKNNISASQF